MRIKFLPVILSLLLMSVGVSSCLDSDDTYEYSSDATIRAFGLDLDSLSTPFTIDQMRREIYNLDSLPMGADTILDRILIDTLETYAAYITSGLNDTIFNKEDSVDLSKGKRLNLKVHAYDGVTIREYSIWVNVHTQDPDSLRWKEMPSLPATPASEKQRSVVLNQNLFVYTSTTSAHRGALSDLGGIQWSTCTVNGLPADAKLASIVQFNDRLYITTESGKAFSSDNGEDWTEMDMQGMQMVTFLGGIPTDEVVGRKNTLTGVFVQDGTKFFCAKSEGESAWRKGEEEVPADFPLSEIYSTIRTTTSGVQQMTIVGYVSESVEATVPWFTKDGLGWADMSTPSDLFCPPMKNPAIMYYGGQYHIMGGDFKAIYSSLAGIGWQESADKFKYPQVEVPAVDGSTDEGTGDDEEDEEEKTEYKSLFEGKGDYSLAIDRNHYIWITWKDGSVWRGRLNKLGFKRQ